MTFVRLAEIFNKVESWPDGRSRDNIPAHVIRGPSASSNGGRVAASSGSKCAVQRISFFTSLDGPPVAWRTR